MRKLKILFVCTGNICRSPLALGVFLNHANLNGFNSIFEADSCGTSSYHVGSLPDSRSIATAQKHSIQLNNKARQICSNDLKYYDFILVMDHLNYEDVINNIQDEFCKNKVFLLRSFDQAVSDDYNVPDPYYGTEADFEEVFEICQRSISGFMTYLINQKLV